MDNFAIRIKNVSKDFHYTSGRSGTLKSLLTSALKSEKNKTRDIQHALKNISFDIKKGEFFGIVGRNGSGKSTLLKMIAGIYQPNKGHISVHGKLVPFIELGVGFNPELTGRENVYLNGALLGFSRREVEKQYQEIVEFAELGQFMDQQLKNYSSGMQVRLAFAMAVRAKADVLLIDEVLAVGDADFQRKCYDYFKKLKKEAKTVVFVSHDMSAVQEYCDRVALIEDSQLATIGTADAVAQKYTQLFTGKTNKPQKISGNRWGDGRVKHTTISAQVSKTDIIITQTFIATKSGLDIMAGIRIRDAAGKEVAGTNTKIEGIKLPITENQQSQKISWKLPNIFSDGEYSIDPSVVYSDGVTVADWWNDAAGFTVTKDRHIPYVVDPGFVVDVKIVK